MTPTTLDERIEQVRAATGYIENDDAVLHWQDFTYGDRVRVIEDEENEGVFSGDEGYVIPCRVGAPEHGNVRVALYFLPDGMDSPNEVSADNIEQVE